MRPTVLPFPFILLLILVQPGQVIGQCLNSSSYGSASAPSGTCPVEISTCNFEDEYNTISNVVAGETYVSESDCGSYITVRSGTFDGPVVADGPSPLTWTAAVNGDHFIHYNTNSSCGTATNCCTTTITCSSCGGGNGCADPYYLGACGSENTCSGSFYDPQGSSSDYCNDQSVVETYCSDAGNCIQVNFSSFDVEASNDSLNIYDGSSTSDPQVGSYDGTTLPNGGSITSHNGCLTFEFTSDGTTTAPGWEASFSCGTCATCSDGVQNGGENGVDCGGPCPACPSCDDGVQNQGETDIDCGGPCSPCQSGDPYIAPTCTDVTYNVSAGNTIDFYDDGGQGGDPCNDGVSGNFCNCGCITTMTFCAGSGENILADFSVFAMYNTTSGFDWMVIYDGPSTSDPILFDNRSGNADNPLGDCNYNGELGGSDAICSSNRCLTFEFNQTGVVNREGWEAEISSTPTACSALPVELLSFESSCHNGRTELSWVTASETDNSHFVVERSMGGERFEAVDTLQGAGTTPSSTEYQSIPPRVEGKAYYRLVQHDFDGNTDTSGLVVSEPCGGGADMELELLGNGTEAPRLAIQLPDPAPDLRLSLYDIRGKCVWKQDRDLPEGYSVLPIDADVSDGIYYLRFRTGQGAGTRKLFLGDRR